MRSFLNELRSKTQMNKEMSQILEIMKDVGILRCKYDQLFEETERLRLDNRRLIEENMKLKLYNKENNDDDQPQDRN